MARKLVKNDFLILTTPPLLKVNKIWYLQICCQKWKKSKLFKIAWNGEKFGQKMIFGLFGPPPPKNLVGVQKKLSKMKKIKVVQNCLKWREYKALHFSYVCHGVPLFFSFIRSFICTSPLKVRLFVRIYGHSSSFVCFFVCMSPPPQFIKIKNKR